MNLLLEHHVRVKDDVNLTVVQRDRLPLWQGSLSTVFVGATPIPHPNKGDGAQILAHKCVTFLDALCDEERHRRVAHEGSPSFSRAKGCTSSAMRLPLGVSDFTGLPFLIRGSSGRNW